MKNTIYKNGVYIYAERKLYKPEEFAGEEGKLVIVMGSDAFEVSPEQIENATWQEAMDFAKSQGGNLPNRWQRMTMWNYRESLNMALLKIGGTQLCEGWEWLCEEYSTHSAWAFYGSNGDAYGYVKRNTCPGRPLLGFQFNELAD